MIDDIHARVPVDRTAAMVTSKGFDYVPDKKIAIEESDFPIPTANPPADVALNPSFSDLSGNRFGRLTVMGLHANRLNRWVCRCDCGRYTTRSAKAVRNPENWGDRCALCQHNAYLKSKDVWKRTGTNPDVRGM